jgi:adenylate cyclase
MAAVKIKSLLAGVEALAGDAIVADLNGKNLLGSGPMGDERLPVVADGETIGWVSGSNAAAVASLLNHLAGKELERKALANEVLHLYREVNLIGQLSEQLAAVLDVEDVARAAVEQAMRLIPGSHAGMLLNGALYGENPALGPESLFGQSILERGVGEIVNEYVGEPGLRAVIAAPLLAKQRAMGLIALADTGDTQYTAAHLKLLSTIAMQAATAIESALASQQLLQREVERKALQLYLPPQVAELVMSSGGAAQLDGVLQPVTALFADIRGFTTMSEQMEAREVVQMLNEYFTAMSGIIFECNGTLDKFIGDCIMALFGAPVATETSVEDAVKAAVGMQMQMELLNRSRLERGLNPFSIGIGLHHGDAVVGNIGSADRVQYTAIGDTINVAARLVSKAAGGEIIVSDAIRQKMPAAVSFDALGEVDLKGRASKMGIFRLG